MSEKIITKFIFLGLIALAVVLEVIGDTFLKKWSLESKNLWLLIGLLIYFVGSIFWIISLKYDYLSRAITVFTALNLILVVLVGVLYFKEDLSLINKIGIALGVISVILIEI